MKMKTIKTISKLTMLFALVAFANTLLAGGNLKLNILPITSESPFVAISTVDATTLKISIENEKGEKVYYKETDANNKDYRKIFDFSNLEEGEYKLSVTANGLTSERSFTLDRQNIAVGNEKNLLDPYFSYKNGVLKVSYLNFPQEKVNLDFYANNELVYSKQIGDKFNVLEGFDLSKLEKGRYSVILSSESNSFTYNLNVK
jgi:hypothetical protein